MTGKSAEPRGRAWLLAVLLGAAMFSRGKSAVADSPSGMDLPARRATFSWDDQKTLRMNVSYRDALDVALTGKLASGLPTTIVLRAYVLRESGGEPLAASFKICRVIFDLWDEVYKLEISQLGAADTVDVSPTIEGVLRRCTEAERLPLAARAILTPQESYYVAGAVEVNPVSPEMLDRIKRWISRPSGTAATAPGDALFGSFVGLFAARIGSADRQLTFRTQRFTL